MGKEDKEGDTSFHTELTEAPTGCPINPDNNIPCCVDVTKCPSDTNPNHNPNQVYVNEVNRLTLCDVYPTCRC